jgi:hypothetical protein
MNTFIKLIFITIAFITISSLFLFLEMESNDQVIENMFLSFCLLPVFCLGEIKANEKYNLYLTKKNISKRYS